MTLRFTSPAAKRGRLILGLTRAADHGIFRVSVNGVVVENSLDLYEPDLITGEIEFSNVALREGSNEIEFTAIGTHPDAREWGPGGGLYKIGIDYLRVP